MSLAVVGFVANIIFLGGIKMSGANKLYKNKQRLNSISDVRKYLARTLNALDDNRIDGERARDVTYVCKTLMKAIEVEQLESKLDKLLDVVENK